MIKLRHLIENARRKPVVGLLVLLLLVALLVLIAFHPAIDALELAASCLAIFAIAISVARLRGTGMRIVFAPPLAALRARPPTPQPPSPVVELLVPLRL